MGLGEGPGAACWFIWAMRKGAAGYWAARAARAAFSEACGKAMAKLVLVLAPSPWLGDLDAEGVDELEESECWLQRWLIAI